MRKTAASDEKSARPWNAVKLGTIMKGHRQSAVTPIHCDWHTPAAHACPRNVWSQLAPMYAICATAPR